MPYRVDIAVPPGDWLDRLVLLGALDVEQDHDGLAALMPDGVSPSAVGAALGGAHIVVSPALGRDDGSVWVLAQRPVRAGGLVIAPAGHLAGPGVLRLADSAAFGTGLHPTTALCLDALASALAPSPPDTALDVGTGSGILALAALLGGVRTVVAVDIDPAAIAAATRNAVLNDLGGRARFVVGGPESISRSWPLVLANVLTAPLVEMAPTLVRRVGHHGRLIVSGVQTSMTADVERRYQHLGMHTLSHQAKDGWSALGFAASW